LASAVVYTKCGVGSSCFPQGDDGSEIDVEFLETASVTGYQWTGFMHGPGAGAITYSIVPMTPSAPYWQPGINFGAAYHAYQTVWTTSSVRNTWMACSSKRATSIGPRTETLSGLSTWRSGPALWTRAGWNPPRFRNFQW
jgi:hypothetical protein